MTRNHLHHVAISGDLTDDRKHLVSATLMRGDDERLAVLLIVRTLPWGETVTILDAVIDLEMATILADSIKTVTSRPEAKP